MQTYRVEWEIEVDADTPRDAALQALSCVQTPDTEATVFDVFDESGEVTRVDLSMEEGE